MSVRDVVKALAEQARSVDDGYQPCSDCRSPTLRGTLAGYAGRCLVCHDLWTQGGPCGSGVSMRPLTHDDKLAILRRMRAVTRSLASVNATDPRRWARELLQRGADGERIPVAHLTMARQALGDRPSAASGWDDDA